MGSGSFGSTNDSMIVPLSTASSKPHKCFNGHAHVARGRLAHVRENA